MVITYKFFKCSHRATLGFTSSGMCKAGQKLAQEQRLHQEALLSSSSRLEASRSENLITAQREEGAAENALALKKRKQAT